MDARLLVNKNASQTCGGRLAAGRLSLPRIVTNQATNAAPERVTESRRRRTEPESDLQLKISRLLLTVSSKLLGFTLQPTSGGGAATKQPGNSAGRSRVSTGLLVLLVYMIGKLLVALALQYAHDYQRLRLDLFEQAKRNGSLIWIHRAEVLERELLAELASSRARLKSLGAPFIQADRFLIQCSMWIVIALAYFVVLEPMWYFSGRPMGFFFVRLLFDERVERQASERMLHRELRRFLVSSRNFCSVSRELEQRLELASLEALDEPARASLARSREARRGLSVTWRVLQVLHARRALDPVNRSRAWVHEMSKVFNTFYLSNLAYSLLFDSAILYWVPVYFLNWHAYETGPLDVWLLAELLILAEITVIGASFYMSLTLANISNQQKFALATRRQLTQTVHANERRLAWLAARPAASCFRAARARDLMNAELALAWFRYRVFVVQFKEAQATFSSLARRAVTLLFSLPPLIRVHLPYFGHSGFNVAMFYFALTALGFIDNFVAPLANFHYKSLNIYRAMHSLAAHIVRCNEQPSGPERFAYNQHLVYLVRKELEHPNEMTDQFATHILGVKITYPSLVQIHYWYIAIVFSASFNTNTLQHFLGDRLSDPFGLIRRIKASFV